MEKERDGQVAVAGLIVLCMTIIAIALIIAGVFEKNVMVVAVGVVGSIVGAMSNALQTPGSLGKAVSNIIPKKEATGDDTVPSK
jgi:hypothetical protein